jgi:hypothetical protein
MKQKQLKWLSRKKKWLSSAFYAAHFKHFYFIRMDVHKFLTPLPHVHFRPKIQTLPLPLTVDVLYVRPQSKIFEKSNPIPKTPVSQSKWDKIYPKSKGIGYSVPLLRWLGLRRGKKSNQAFFMWQRILEKYRCFPILYIVFNLYKLTL